MIVPAISFVSTATAVSRAGAMQVFVDIEPCSFNIDPARVEEAITPKTKAIIAVHFGGALAQIEELCAVAARHAVADRRRRARARQRWRGRRAGSFGSFGSFSFQNGKVLPAGEGGMLVTNDDSLAEQARSIANQGRKRGESYYKHFELGTDFRIRISAA